MVARGVVMASTDRRSFDTGVSQQVQGDIAGIVGRLEALMGQRDQAVASAMGDFTADGVSEDYAVVEQRWKSASQEVRTIINLVKTTMMRNDETAGGVAAGLAAAGHRRLRRLRRGPTRHPGQRRRVRLRRVRGQRLGVPKARVLALAECGTHAFLAAEVGAYASGEKTLAHRLYPRLRPDELLTADRNFYSFQAWGLAARTGAALLWRAPTQLNCPVVKVLPDGTYLSVLIDPTVRSARRRTAILTAAKAGEDLTDEPAHLVRVVEYDVPDRAGNGTGELIVVLSTILDPAQARADELAAAYHQRWEEETANDQLKTHLRGPGRILRSRLPELVHQEIWAWLLVHYAISVLITRAAQAADLDPDPVSFTRVLRIIPRTTTGTAAFPP